MRSKPKFERTSTGLRDALMCEMEDLRSGLTTPTEALAFAELAEKVIESMKTDLASKVHEDRLIEAQKERDLRQRELREETLLLEDRTNA